MRLDIFDLKLFLNIVETGSLSKAAQYSSLTVQACSERLKKLEQRYSVLFIRHATGLQLTPAGHIFAKHARLLLQQHLLLQQDLQPYLQHDAEHITLWCSSSAQIEYLPKLLPHFLLQHQQLHIQLQEAESTTIIQNLQQGQATLGIISDVFDSGYLQTQHFINDPLVIICPIQHELTQYNTIELGHTSHYAWIGLMPHHALQQSIDKQFVLLSTIIQYRLRLLDFQAIAQVVSSGLGIAIMPARIAQRFHHQYQFSQVKILGKWANRALQLACHDFAKLPEHYRLFSQYLLQHAPTEIIIDE